MILTFKDGKMFYQGSCVGACDELELIVEQGLVTEINMKGEDAYFDPELLIKLYRSQIKFSPDDGVSLVGRLRASMSVLVKRGKRG